MGGRNKDTNKAQKGTVSISHYKQGLRLRWRYNNKRPELYISSSVVNYTKIAHAVKGIIERDIIIGNYDESLVRYNELLHKAAIQDATLENQILPPTYNETRTRNNLSSVDCISLFNQYLAAKGKSEHSLSSYCYDARQMLKRWNTFKLEDVPQLLNAENVSNKTFNDRRNCLYQFFEWCKRKHKIEENPLADVSTKKRNRAIDQRKPFTVSESRSIIEALRTDMFSKQSYYKHSQYWRFVAFYYI